MSIRHQVQNQLIEKFQEASSEILPQIPEESHLTPLHLVPDRPKFNDRSFFIITS